MQGTYFMTTRKTLTEFAPDGLLPMLLTHSPSEEKKGVPVWFIDRDAGMFRWILLALTTGQLVEHDTVNVPKDVWDKEIDYYGLFNSPLVPETRKRQREERLEDADMRQVAQRHLEHLEKRRDEALVNRQKVYKVLLEHCMARVNPEGRTGWDFVTPQVSKGDFYPYGYPEGVRNLNLKLLWDYREEVRAYASKFGFNLTVDRYNDNSTVKKYAFHPASETKLKKAHEELHVSMRPILEKKE